MIDEVDAALRALLKDEALGGADVEVVFDAPTKDWAARRNAPMVNAYLYDIREDVRKRTRGLTNQYNDAGVVIARRLPPRFYNLSYLVTAWTQRPEDEHRLLAQILLCFSNYESMPPERLSGQIGSLNLPVEMRISLPPPEDRSFADVWTALGGELKPSIDVVLSVPLTPERLFPAGPPVREGTVVTLQDVTGDAVDRAQRGNEVGTASAGAVDPGRSEGHAVRSADATAEPGSGGATESGRAPRARARRGRGGMTMDVGAKGRSRNPPTPPTPVEGDD